MSTRGEGPGGREAGMRARSGYEEGDGGVRRARRWEGVREGEWRG